MKKYLFIVFSFVFGLLKAQDLPKGIAYQAVAIHNSPTELAGANVGELYWSNKTIQVRFTIFDKYPGGTAQLVETHSKVTTDKFGIFNLVIGQGNNVSGDLFEVNWALGQAHLQVEIDFENNGTFSLIGIERFWSVPYALNAGTQNTDSLTIIKVDNRLDSIDNTLKTIDSLYQIVKTKVAQMRTNDLDTVVGNEFQSLSIKGDSLSISDGNTIPLNYPTNLDNDSTNEIQDLTLNGRDLGLTGSTRTVRLSSSNGIDTSNVNEIQSLSLKGDTLSISGGNSIDLTKVRGNNTNSTIYFSKPITTNSRPETFYTIKTVTEICYLQNGNKANYYKEDILVDSFSLNKGDRLKIILETDYNCATRLQDSSGRSVYGYILNKSPGITFGSLSCASGGPSYNQFIYMASKVEKIYLIQRGQKCASSPPSIFIPNYYVEIN